MTLTLDELKTLSKVLKTYISLIYGSNPAAILESKEAELNYKIVSEIKEREKYLVKE